MSIQQILLELRAIHGSFDKVAKHYEVDRDYLYRLYSNERLNPTPTFLARLGIKVKYEFDRSVRSRP